MNRTTAILLALVPVTALPQEPTEWETLENSLLVLNPGTELQWSTTVIRYIRPIADISLGNCLWWNTEDSTYELECPTDESTNTILEFHYDAHLGTTTLQGLRREARAEAGEEVEDGEDDPPPQAFLDLVIAGVADDMTVGKFSDAIRQETDSCDFTWNQHSSEYVVECVLANSRATACYNWKLARAPGNRALLTGAAGDCVTWKKIGTLDIKGRVIQFLLVAQAADS